MRVITICIAGALLVTVATGCAPAPQPARHSVDEYRAHAGLRDEQLALCANDPGTLGHTPDCINAKEAAKHANTRSLRELPPVRLPPPAAQKNPDAPDATR